MSEDFKTLVRDYGQVTSEDIQIQLSHRTQTLARELVEKINEAIRTKEYLKNLNKRINDISFRDLPDLFNEQNLHGMEMSNGVRLALTPYYRASLPVKMDPAKRKEGIEYLRGIAPELIKTKVLLEYGADEQDAAQAVITFLRGLDIDPDVKEDVHHSTLTSWVKEQYEAGVEVEFDKVNAKIGSFISVEIGDKEKSTILKRLRKAQSEALGTSDEPDPQSGGESPE